MPLINKAIVSILLASFIASSVQAPVCAQIDPLPFMPKPGTMVPLSPEYTPAYLKGIVIHPEDPLKFDFIIYKGDRSLTDAQKREEYTKLTKYFLASLAIPDKNQWVNLSPYEKDRIIKDDFGKTEMGRDLLAQDYLLKQITASLIYPQDNLGKKFWQRVYAQAQKQFGTTNIAVNTFNRVWILPDNALIYEKGNTAYVLKNHLKVMLEEDYLSLKKHNLIANHTVASQIARQIILPELEREVNADQNFAPLRQVYSGMLLAAWFKRELKKSLLSQVYANKAKVRGVDQDPRTNEEIYQQYLKAYKKGVFNFIKEDAGINGLVPRKYFSGGTQGYDHAQIGIVHQVDPAQNVQMQGMISRSDLAAIALQKADRAMANTVTDAVEWLNSNDSEKRWIALQKLKDPDFYKIVDGVYRLEDLKGAIHALKERTRILTENNILDERNEVVRVLEDLRRGKLGVLMRILERDSYSRPSDLNALDQVSTSVRAKNPVLINDALDRLFLIIAEFPSEERLRVQNMIEAFKHDFMALSREDRTERITELQKATDGIFSSSGHPAVKLILAGLKSIAEVEDDPTPSQAIPFDQITQHFEKERLFISYKNFSFEVPLSFNVIWHEGLKPEDRSLILRLDADTSIAAILMMAVNRNSEVLGFISPADHKIVFDKPDDLYEKVHLIARAILEHDGLVVDAAMLTEVATKDPEQITGIYNDLIKEGYKFTMEQTLSFGRFLLGQISSQEARTLLKDITYRREGVSEENLKVLLTTTWIAARYHLLANARVALEAYLVSESKEDQERCYRVLRLTMYKLSEEAAGMIFLEAKRRFAQISENSAMVSSRSWIPFGLAAALGMAVSGPAQATRNYDETLRAPKYVIDTANALVKEFGVMSDDPIEVYAKDIEQARVIVFGQMVVYLQTMEKISLQNAMRISKAVMPYIKIVPETLSEDEKEIIFGIRLNTDVDRASLAERDAVMTKDRALEILNGKRILIVEDDEGIREALKKFLERNHMKVDVAENGIKALMLLDTATERDSFDYVLSDLNMPGMSGEELARLIRTSGKPYANVKMLIQTDRLGKFDERVAERSKVRIISKSLILDGSIISFARELSRLDQAMTIKDAADLGGIDMNAANLNLQIKRDGHGMPLPLSQQDLAQLSHMEGLEPKILSIKPASLTTLFARP
jgi:CheY-like chemotaxis protein